MRKAAKTLLLIGMGLMIPCYAFTVLNVNLAPWGLYAERSRKLLLLSTAACAALFALLLRAADRRERWLVQNEKAVLAAACVFYFVVQLIMAKMLRFSPNTDAEQCYTAAQLLVDTGTYGYTDRPYNYFTRYPFNLGIVYALAGIFRFFGFFGWTDRFMQAVLSCTILFTLGLLASARVVRRVGGVRAQARMLILFACFLPLTYCTTEIYTDVFSLSFPTMIIYCAMRISESKDKRHVALWAAAFALCSFLGSQLRFTSIIASIASIIWLVLSRRPLRGVAACAVLLAAMLSGGALVDVVNAQHIDPEEMAEAKLSPLHHIAMGMPTHVDDGYGQYGEGWWYLYSTSFETQQERNEVLLREIIDRVYYLRYPNRLLNMMSRKNISTFGNGTFVLHEIIESDNHEPDNWVKEIMFRRGALYPAYYHLCTGMFMAQMILAIAACVQAIRRRDTRGAPVFIALVGAFILLCIWETRGRYFFQFEMLLLSAAAMLDTRLKRA